MLIRIPNNKIGSYGLNSISKKIFSALFCFFSLGMNDVALAQTEDAAAAPSPTPLPTNTDAAKTIKAAGRTAKKAVKSVGATVKVVGTRAETTVKKVGTSAETGVKKVGTTAQKTVKKVGGAAEKTLVKPSEPPAAAKTPDQPPTANSADQEAQTKSADEASAKPSEKADAKTSEPASEKAAAKAGGKSFSGNISWYGSKFNGKKTASGEIFDMNRKTAAHRTLAFSSRVMVEDPRTGGSVVVKVNDRGPFVKSRVMDISRGAATSLGTINRGVCYVDCTVLTH